MSRKMIDYKVEDGKIVSIDGYEVGGSGGYEVKKLIVTENGTYNGEFEAYKPVYVSVPPVQGDTLKALLDAKKTAKELFYYYEGTNVDGILYYTTTSNVTDMTSMFSNCRNLITIPLIDTSKVTNVNSMFRDCSNLTSIPELDTSNVTYSASMFNGCSKLTSVPELDMSKSNSTDFMFSGCTKLTSIGIYGFTHGIDISSTALEHDAIVALLNQAGIAYQHGVKITMGSAKLALLSDEEKAIATNKGWTLA